MTVATAPPRLQAAEASSVPECPYVGLVPFGEQEAPFFFGREREAATIIANLTAARLTLLYAPSGVGKSSVLRAGVLPQLRRRAAEDAEDDLEPAVAAVAYVSDWSTNPLETAAAAIRQAVAPVIDTAEAPSDGAMAQLGLDWLRTLLSDAGVTVLYLVLDQFEEYFFYHHAADAASDPLVAALADILASRQVNVHMLLSVREDALAGLDRFKGQVPHLFSNYLRLEHLDRDAARSAIEGPLTEYNRLVPTDKAMTVEPGLVEDILEQVRAGNDRVDPDGTSTAASDLVHGGLIEAPYLQLVLTRIWEQEVSRGSHVLRQATLAELGGAQTVVSSHLDTVVAGLSPEQVPVAAACLRHLVTASGTKIALTAMDLADWSGQPDDDVERLLETLASGRQRILRPVPPAAGLSGPPRYEIFHDVMGVAVLAWRRRYLAKVHLEEANKRLVAEQEQARAQAMTARRKVRVTRALIASALVVLLLIVGVVLKVHQDSRSRQQMTRLADASAALLHNPALSLGAAADAYRLGDDTETRSAVLAAASAPRSTVVAGPNPANGGTTLQRMKTTPDGRHAVAYDRTGRVIVIDDAGRKQADLQVVGLHGVVVDLAPAPDASQVAVATDKGEVSVVDVLSGRRTDLLTSIGSEVFWLSTSGATRVLVRGSDNSATLFNPATGAVTARLPGQFSEVASIDGGSHVVTSPVGSGPLRVWDAATGSPLAQSETFTAAPYRLAQDGTKIVGVATASDAGSNLVIWDWHSVKPAVLTPFYPRNSIETVTVNPVQHTVLIAFDKVVEGFRTEDGQEVLTLPQQTDWVDDATTSTDGDWAVTAGFDGQVLVWSQRGNMQPVRPTYELQGDGGSVRSAAFIGNGVLALEENGTMRWWDLPRPPRFQGAENWVTDLALSPDGHELATASHEGHGFILDPADITHQIAEFGDGTQEIDTVRFDPTDPHRVIELGLYANAPELWQWSQGAPSKEPVHFEATSLGDFDALASVAISPDGNTVVAGDYTGGLHYWNSHSGRLLHDRDQPGDGSQSWLDFDPSGRYFAVTTRGGIRLTGPDGSQRMLSLPNPTVLAFDPSGDRVAAATDGGEVKVWSTSGTDDAPLQDFVAHSNRLESLSFSRDGSLLAAGTADDLVEVRDVGTGGTVALVRQHGDSVTGAVFAPGGNGRLISASDDQTVAEWPCAACADQNAVIHAAVDATPGQ